MSAVVHLDSTVQTFADRLGQAVILFDAQLAVVAFSVHNEAIDQLRLGMILSRHMSVRAAQMLREYKVAKDPGAVLIPAAADIPPLVTAALRYRGRLTGYVMYSPSEDDDPDRRDAADIQRAREELGSLLAAREAEQREGADYILQLLTTLFDGSREQRNTAASELLDNRLVAEAPRYATTVFHLKSGPGGARTTDGRLVLEHVLDEVARGIPMQTVSAVLDSEGVLIIPRGVDYIRIQKLLLTPQYSNVSAGIGQVHGLLADMRDSRREARIALRATIHDPTRYGQAATWSELGLDRLLLQLPLERITFADLPPGIAALMNTVGGPDLTETLESYLDNGTDAQKTAQHLHIHRSTLYYRLGRIRDLINSNLTDGTVRRELHTALRVATLAGLR